MSDAERGSVEPTLIAALNNLLAFLPCAPWDATKYNDAYRAFAKRLESAASPPPAPRAAGAGEVVAWVVWAQDAENCYNDFFWTEKLAKAYGRELGVPFRVEPLVRTGAAAPSETGAASEDVQTLAKWVVGYWPGLEDGITWPDTDNHPAIAAARRILGLPARASTPEST